MTASVSQEYETSVWQAMGPLVRGLLTGAAGFGTGVAFLAALRTSADRSAWSLEMSMPFGYALGLVGWLFGVGA